MNSVEISLEYPVEHDGQSYSSLTMRRVTMRDILAVQKEQRSDPLRGEIQLFANLCEVPKEVIEALDMKDYGRVVETHEGFTKPSKDEGNKDPD